MSSPAAAQSWKWDIGVNVGYSWFTPSLGRDETTLQGAGGKVMFDDGFMVGFQPLTLWLKPGLGLRFNGRYREGSVTGNDLNDAKFVEHVNLWGATADLMFRLGTPAETFTKMEMLPYIALGAGAKWHNPNGDGFTCNETGTGKSFNCSPFVTGIPGAPKGWALGEQNAVAGLIGIGADWRLARAIALRTELNDMIFKPQFESATIPAAGSRTWTVSKTNSAKLTHELGVQVGLQFLMGIASPPVVAVAPPPPPPPAPAPAPEIRRESINVCVVDPTATNGLRMQSVTLIEGRDTVIGDRPFRESLGSIRTAAGADWYVQGQPLVMTIGTGKASFTTYGSTRVIDAGDVTYVGTVNGYPVYADRDDVSSFISELNEQNRSGQDLGIILNNQKTLRTTFEGVKVLYVPTSASGCVFQAVQRQEEVRKSGK
ncbi:MAG TPA: hypothetical protein VM100_08030 [Longimicrobiales bacterium]|nr:hypothetical protein [Longimicrobiales bacterium]